MLAPTPTTKRNKGIQMQFSFSPCSLENILFWGRRSKQYQVLWICNISKTGTTSLYRDKTDPLNMATLYSHFNQPA